MRGVGCIAGEKRPPYPLKLKKQYRLSGSQQQQQATLSRWSWGVGVRWGRPNGNNVTFPNHLLFVSRYEIIGYRIGAHAHDDTGAN